ncbi:MAG: acylneuraminate cytidylyltransferase family protein [Acidobacteriota bacterium]|nr:acylneuraminate cytidylyltransferase family protein [Acidobacteriota bacterium]
MVGIIPARGGSKAIPRKNLAPLGGRSLLAWTCVAARTASSLTRVVVSTDDEEIAREAERCGVAAPFRRSAKLAGDAAPTLPVIQEAVTFLERSATRVEAVVVLQPTSPFRRAEHIDGAVRLLFETGADSVVSVVEVPHQFNPMSVMRIDQGRLVPFLEGQGTGTLRRQDKPAVYARNGAAVYAIRRDVLMGGSLFGHDCRALVMSGRDSIDIDGPEDLALAEALLHAEAGRGRA